MRAPASKTLMIDEALALDFLHEVAQLQRQWIREQLLVLSEFDFKRPAAEAAPRSSCWTSTF